jgi:hypothetical protein
MPSTAHHIACMIWNMPGTNAGERSLLSASAFSAASE